MIAFIDQHRDVASVEHLCRQLQLSPSTYYAHKAAEREPERRSVRVRRDERLRDEIGRVHAENLGVYGVRKVWRQLKREGISCARCTVERLMRGMGLKGVVRGARIRTTNPDTAAPCPLDQVNRQFTADRPNQLWVADFTYVATWQGFVYVAFVIDVYARSIVGWRVHNTMQSSLVLDALEQAIAQRLHVGERGPIHHSDRGSQYLSIRYSERLAEANISASVGSVGDSYDNALAETIIGLFKTEIIRRCGPWRNIDQVEKAVLEWVDWFNNRRLLSTIGYRPPAEVEAEYHQTELANAA